MKLNEEVRTACPYCGVGCGLIATRRLGKPKSITGDPDHPANSGRLCSKGSALIETLDLEGRLLRPVVNGMDSDWETALSDVARRLSRTISEHGPDSVAFYVSGQLLTEDYYVANKLMKGFIGSANIDTNSRLCMASSVAGHQRAFGEDIVPGNYEDLELADLVVLVGSNAAWCHPVLYQRMFSGERPRQPKVVVIDPRRTATCDGADLHLPLKPGSEAVLFNGLLAELERRGKIDRAFVARSTEGFEAAMAEARSSAPDAAAVARACELEESDVARFFDWFVETEKSVTLYSQGVNQSSSGTDKVNAIINCHLATARIGRSGMGPLSLTGQPNAMGGREVGGLATQLAAHMRIEDADHRDIVRRFWQAPKMPEKPGLKAVDMFQAIAEGRVRAVWIMATNPVVSLPDAERVREALRACDLVIVSDCMRHTDTTEFADILLPAAAWGEKDGTVTNSERRISRQRVFLPPPGEAKPDWWIVSEVARQMGFGEAFPYQSPAEVFREHAALSGFGNDGTRAFDISGLAGIDDKAYENLTPLQWPVTAEHPGGTARLLGDGRFFTGTGKARFIAVVPRAPKHAPDADYPLVLNTGRSRDHWHTLTRTGKSPRLSAHAAEPVAEVHPKDAAAFHVKDGDLANVVTKWGEAAARIRVTSDQRPGSVFMPMHWNDQFASHARANAAVNPVTDPVSGQPESKHTPARITPLHYAWHAFAVSRAAFAGFHADHWVQARGDNCWRCELSGAELPSDWNAWAQGLIGPPVHAEDWVAFQNTAARVFRFARFTGSRLDGCVFISVGIPAVSRAWLASLFAKPRLSPSERVQLLSGNPATGQDSGGIVCSCFAVGLRQITDAISAGSARSVDDIGKLLRAGTSCGSCKPELNGILQRTLAGKEPSHEAGPGPLGTAVAIG
jgi:assimilatory nitrate reductase catalytic subunit